MYKKITRLLLYWTAAFAASLTGCTENTDSPLDINSSDTFTEFRPLSVFELGDDTCTVDLSGEIDIQGEGAWYGGGVLSITKGGTYCLSGTIFDGSVYIDTDDEVKLILNGLNVINNDGAAIYCHNAEKLSVELAENSENILIDGARYTFEGNNEFESENEPNAALYSKSDLVIGGSGSLSITGNYGLAIRCNAFLTIKGGNISLSAASNGIRGTDSVVIEGGNISINADKDGIKSTNGTDSGKGIVSVKGGNISISAGEDGIQAAQGLSLSGGVVSVSSFERCIYSAGELEITDGEYSLSSLNSKAIASERNLRIDGGRIDITRSVEGVESKALFTVNGGEIYVIAEDDGFNCGGGKGQKDDTPHDMFINGGYICINAEGDGIDSNGNITVNGGTVIVNGPVSGRDGALDSGDNNNFVAVNGGTLIAAGSLDMAELPDCGSQQSCLCAAVSLKGGDTLAVQDSAGNNLMIFTAEKQVQHIVISTPDIKRGETYKFYTGAVPEGTCTDGLYSSDTVLSDSGELVCTITADFAVSSTAEMGGKRDRRCRRIYDEALSA